jgi:hypothetical protein
MLLAFSFGFSQPTTNAPTPTKAAADVISIFSDAYTNVATNYNPNWGQSGSVTLLFRRFLALETIFWYILILIIREQILPLRMLRRWNIFTLMYGQILQELFLKFHLSTTEQEPVNFW